MGSGSLQRITQQAITIHQTLLNVLPERRPLSSVASKHPPMLAQLKAFTCAITA